MKFSIRINVVLATILILETSGLPPVTYSYPQDGYYNHRQWSGRQPVQPPAQQRQEWSRNQNTYSVSSSGAHSAAESHHSHSSAPTNEFNGMKTSESLVPTRTHEINNGNDQSKLKVVHVSIPSSGGHKMIALPVTGDTSNIRVVHINPEAKGVKIQGIDNSNPINLDRGQPSQQNTGYSQAGAFSSAMSGKQTRMESQQFDANERFNSQKAPNNDTIPVEPNTDNADAQSEPQRFREVKPQENYYNGNSQPVNNYGQRLPPKHAASHTEGQASASWTGSQSHGVEHNSGWYYRTKKEGTGSGYLSDKPGDGGLKIPSNTNQGPENQEQPNHNTQPNRSHNSPGTSGTTVHNTEIYNRNYKNWDRPWGEHARQDRFPINGEPIPYNIKRRTRPSNAREPNDSNIPNNTYALAPSSHPSSSTATGTAQTGTISDDDGRSSVKSQPTATGEPFEYQKVPSNNPMQVPTDDNTKEQPEPDSTRFRGTKPPVTDASEGNKPLNNYGDTESSQQSDSYAEGQAAASPSGPGSQGVGYNNGRHYPVNRNGVRYLNGKPSGIESNIPTNNNNQSPANQDKSIQDTEPHFNNYNWRNPGVQGKPLPNSDNLYSRNRQRPQERDQVLQSGEHNIPYDIKWQTRPGSPRTPNNGVPYGPGGINNYYQPGVYKDPAVTPDHHRRPPVKPFGANYPLWHHHAPNNSTQAIPDGDSNKAPSAPNYTERKPLISNGSSNNQPANNFADAATSQESVSYVEDKTAAGVAISGNQDVKPINSRYHPVTNDEFGSTYNKGRPNNGESNSPTNDGLQNTANQDQSIGTNEPGSNNNNWPNFETQRKPYSSEQYNPGNRNWREPFGQNRKLIYGEPYYLYNNNWQRLSNYGRTPNGESYWPNYRYQPALPSQPSSPAAVENAANNKNDAKAEPVPEKFSTQSMDSSRYYSPTNNFTEPNGASSNTDFSSSQATVVASDSSDAQIPTSNKPTHTVPIHRGPAIVHPRVPDNNQPQTTTSPSLQTIENLTPDSDLITTFGSDDTLVSTTSAPLDDKSEENYDYDYGTDTASSDSDATAQTSSNTRRRKINKPTKTWSIHRGPAIVHPRAPENNNVQTTDSAVPETYPNSSPDYNSITTLGADNILVTTSRSPLDNKYEENYDYDYGTDTASSDSEATAQASSNTQKQRPNKPIKTWSIRRGPAIVHPRAPEMGPDDTSASTSRSPLNDKSEENYDYDYGTDTASSDSDATAQTSSNARRRKLNKSINTWSIRRGPAIVHPGAPEMDLDDTLVPTSRSPLDDKSEENYDYDYGTDTASSDSEATAQAYSNTRRRIPNKPTRTWSIHRGPAIVHPTARENNQFQTTDSAVPETYQNSSPDSNPINTLGPDNILVTTSRYQLGDEPEEDYDYDYGRRSSSNPQATAEASSSSKNVGLTPGGRRDGVDNPQDYAYDYETGYGPTNKPGRSGAILHPKIGIPKRIYGRRPNRDNTPSDIGDNPYIATTVHSLEGPKEPEQGYSYEYDETDSLNTDDSGTKSSTGSTPTGYEPGFPEGHRPRIGIPKFTYDQPPNMYNTPSSTFKAPQFGRYNNLSPASNTPEDNGLANDETSNFENNPTQYSDEAAPADDYNDNSADFQPDTTNEDMKETGSYSNALAKTNDVPNQRAYKNQDASNAKIGKDGASDAYVCKNNFYPASVGKNQDDLSPIEVIINIILAFRKVFNGENIYTEIPT